MVALVDHLWQTLQVFVCLAVFAFLTRHNSARFRLWLWRAAALKLVIPLQVFYSLGVWLGFPVTHSAVPPPATLMRIVSELKPWVAPAAHVDGGARWVLLTAQVLATAAALWGIRQGLRIETPRAIDELRRLELDPDDRPPGVGLLNAALMTAWALLLVMGPTVAGAIDDRLRRQRLLQRNELGLRDADVQIRPAAPGMGSRYRILVDEGGVTIRNASLREISGMAYGVSVYLVRGQHFVKEGEVDWLTGSRHDVHVRGPVLEPEEFDTYALREPLTKALATQFGLEIHDMGKCAPPCGRWGSLVLPTTTAGP
jgi:hypothetical protein